MLALCPDDPMNIVWIFEQSGRPASDHQAMFSLAVKAPSGRIAYRSDVVVWRNVLKAIHLDQALVSPVTSVAMMSRRAPTAARASLIFSSRQASNSAGVTVAVPATAEGAGAKESTAAKATTTESGRTKTAFGSGFPYQGFPHWPGP